MIGTSNGTGAWDWGLGLGLGVNMELEPESDLTWTASYQRSSWRRAFAPIMSIHNHVYM